MDRRRGVSRIPVEAFCLTVPKVSVGGEAFFVSLLSGIEKVWISGWEYQIFPSKIFSLIVLKISGGGYPLVFQ